MVTSLAGLLVAATTPFPDLLALPTRFLPRVVGDSLVLTYRAIFILADQVETFWLAVRARGGFVRRPAAGSLPWAGAGDAGARRLDVTTTGLALSVLRGVDLSTRLYDVMRMRGYQGRLAPRRLSLQRGGLAPARSRRPAWWRSAWVRALHWWG